MNAPPKMRDLISEPLSDPAALTSRSSGTAVWWLGQAGFLIAQGGLRIVVDPYLSDSLAEKYRGKKYAHERMMRPPVRPQDLHGIDWVLCTHAHTDHMDPGTLPGLLAANAHCRVLAPRAEKATTLARGVPTGRLVLIDAGETVDLGGVLCTATPAAHEEIRTTSEGHLFLGYLLKGDGVTLWHSGDTVPFDEMEELLQAVSVDLALLPVNGRDAERASNGVPGNLTLHEALDLSAHCGFRATLGHHFGLFAFNTIDPVAAQAEVNRLGASDRFELVRQGMAYRIVPRKAPR